MAKSRHYVNNKKMLEVLTKWREDLKIARELGTPEPRVPEYIGEAIWLIANNLSLKPNFRNYSFVEEMIGDGIENCLRYIENFDPAKSSNPFSYFTQIIYYAFLRRIKAEKRESYTKYKLFTHDATFNNLVEGTNGDDHFSIKLTYDPDKMKALEDIFEKKTKKNEKDDDLGIVELLLSDSKDESAQD